MDVSQRVSLNFRFTPSLGGSMRAVSYFAPFLVAFLLYVDWLQQRALS